MSTPHHTRAPTGQLSTYTKERVADERFAHDVYRKGQGPAVIVMTEMPGISPMVVGFADRLVALGVTAVLPDLFGEAGRDPVAGSKASAAVYGLRSMAGGCISKEFTTWAVGRSSPIVTWLRALAAREHERCGGPGVGAVGMCFTGGFALAMAVDERIVAPVLSQPSLPFGATSSRKSTIDCNASDLDIVANRCAAWLRVLGLRFEGDRFVPPERFAFLRQRLGDGFVGVELAQRDGNPDDMFRTHHSVLTSALVDEPGEPTRAALDQVLELFRTKLLP